MRWWRLWLRILALPLRLGEETACYLCSLQPCKEKHGLLSVCCVQKHRCRQSTAPEIQLFILLQEVAISRWFTLS